MSDPAEEGPGDAAEEGRGDSASEEGDAPTGDGTPPTGDGDPPTGDEDSSTSDGDPPSNDGHRFDRLPATPEERVVPGRPTREAVVAWWDERFGIPPATWDRYSFWERGKGKVWAFAGEAPDPIRVQGLGMSVLRTRQEHWKPTTNAVQRFGRAATRNVLTLDPTAAARFVRGEDGPVDWDGDWGYLIVAHELAGRVEPIGVGLYLHGELRSTVPKGRREDVRVLD